MNAPTSSPATPRAGDPFAGPGWPRPRAQWQPERPYARPDRADMAGNLPVPWVIAAGGDGNPCWTTMHPDATEAHIRRLCQICGEPTDGTILMGVVGDAERRETNGPGCHPRCMALAIQFCPHFGRDADAVVAFRYDGPGPGYREPQYGWAEPDNPFYDNNAVDADATPMTRAEVRELARLDPLGLAHAADRQPRPMVAA